MTFRTIVVIGASRGIGEEIVLQLSQNKENHIVALSRNVEVMSQKFNAENISFYHFDLSSQNIHKNLSEILQNIPTVDILINNAGVLIKKPFLELTENDLKKSYQINSIGLIWATKFFIPKMEKNGGHILNISTMGAIQGSVKFPGLVAYTSSKAGLTTFTELFAEEYKNSKIKMNCLCLGAVKTEMFEKAFPDGEAPVTASEMAEYIVDFSLNGARFYNGKILSVSSSTP